MARSLLGRVNRRITRALRYRRFGELARGGRHSRDLAIVVGNCQADPLSQLLSTGPLGETFEIVRVPPVHLVDAAQTSLLHRLLPKVTLLITQKVRDDYRGHPVGDRQLEELLSNGARTVRYPVMYYEGDYPYQVYLRHTGHTSESAPLTSYADLRTIAAASRGAKGDEGARLADGLHAPASALQANADRSRQILLEREGEVDVTVSEAVSPLAFHTVNHPSNPLLAHVADGVARHLGSDGVHIAPVDQYLDDIYSPVEEHVLAAVGGDRGDREEWRIRGERVPRRAVFEAHLDWLHSRPELIDAAVKQHAAKLELFGFAG